MPPNMYDVSLAHRQIYANYFVPVPLLYILCLHVVHDNSNFTVWHGWCVVWALEVHGPQKNYCQDFKIFTLSALGDDIIFRGISLEMGLVIAGKRSCVGAQV